MHFDTTGKISLDHIYTQPDPRAYFSTLRALDYRIPQLAKPYFTKLIEEYRSLQQNRAPNILDIGCSYGINAALLKFDVTMDELYERYCGIDARSQTRSTLLTRDRDLVRSRNRRTCTRFVGLDTSHPALSYALSAGFVDDVVYADLEQRDPTERQRQQFTGVDLVISTGCLGYVTERTIARVVSASSERRPWMAHFVLRMFPFEPVAESLAGLGYETVHIEHVFKQRRFASPQEQSLVLDTLWAVGVDPRGLEADGWLYAQLHVSRPRDTKSYAVVDLATSNESSSSPKPPRLTMNAKSDQDWSTRTFGNEDRLPRVPLPTVAASCERFLAWCAPLLTAAELATTEAAVASFREPDGAGHKLHAALEEYNAGDGVHSWLDTFWQSRYLGRRDRIAINANYFFLFKDAGLQQVDRAAGLIAGAVNYKLALDEELVAPIVARGQALSMEQNKFLFATTRIPGPVQDTVRAPYSEQCPGPSRARHIVVFFRGHMFRMDVLGPAGRPHTLDDLVAGLQSIMKAGAVRAAPEQSVGHLTTMARAQWAATRHALLGCHPGNADALDAVETALFCVCLEDFVPAHTLAACDNLLHGDSGNRWFDKAVSLIVFGDGTAGINVEHCGLDGTTVLSFVDALLGASAQEHSARSGALAQGLPSVTPVEFVLDGDLRADVRAAGAAFAAYGANVATTIESFEDFGGNRAKALGMSPDAFVQLAYQLAHQRAKGMVGATYESIATRQYRRGRTEAMRVVTPEVMRFVAMMDDPDVDVATRNAAFRAAADAHVERAKACQTGQAPEQHLWELALIAQRRGEALGVPAAPALYETPGWLTMRDDYLSTSSAPSVNVEYFGFGSTSSRCIGIAYVLLPDRFNLYLSTPRPVADDMFVFADKLREAVRELQDLLETEKAAV